MGWCLNERRLCIRLLQFHLSRVFQNYGSAGCTNERWAVENDGFTRHQYIIHNESTGLHVKWYVQISDVSSHQDLVDYLQLKQRSAEPYTDITYIYSMQYARPYIPFSSMPRTERSFLLSSPMGSSRRFMTLHLLIRVFFACWSSRVFLSTALKCHTHPGCKLLSLLFSRMTFGRHPMRISSVSTFCSLRSLRHRLPAIHSQSMSELMIFNAFTFLCELSAMALVFV